MEQHEPAEKTYDLERLIFFSDGVFAIVITLLVIELHPPHGWDRTFAGLLRAEWRALLAYAVSFLAVGAYWNLHRQLFSRIVRFHPSLVAANLLLLGIVVLLPFAAELIFESGPRGQPFAIYLGVIAAAGYAQALLWGVAAYATRVVDGRMTGRQRLTQLLGVLVPPVILSAAAAQAALGGAVSVFWLLPMALLVAFARVRARMLAR